MLVEMLKSKILRAETTDARIDYEGSLAIDLDLMDKVGMLPYEKILVGNISNGKRFETYAIPAPRGSGTFSVRGAAAHLGNVGDLLVIMSFAQVDEREIAKHLPRTITLAEKNTKIIKSQNMIDGDSASVGNESDDTLIENALKIIGEAKEISISHIQRRLGIGYNRAANLLETLKERGLIDKIK